MCIRDRPAPTSDTCSGRGLTFGTEENATACACWGCYTGTMCELERNLSECAITADSSAPSLTWAWWARQPSSSLAVDMTLAYRTGDYMPDPFPLLPAASDAVDPSRTLLHELGSAIRALHARCLLYTSPSPRDRTRSRMPSSA